MIRTFILAFTLSLYMLVSHGKAQTPPLDSETPNRAVISGIITDETGADLPDADIRLEHALQRSKLCQS